MKKLTLALALSFTLAIGSPGEVLAQSASARATASDPTYSAGAPVPLSTNLSGYLRAIVQPTASVSGGTLVSSTIISGTTAQVVKASPGQVYGVKCFANSATLAYVKFYDAVTATVGVGTPKDRLLCPSSASSNGAGFIAFNPLGDTYVTGITYIVTLGIADNDVSVPVSATYLVSVHYK